MKKVIAEDNMESVVFANQNIVLETNVVLDEISVVKKPSTISNDTVFQGNLNADNNIGIYGQITLTISESDIVLNCQCKGNIYA